MILIRYSLTKYFNFINKNVWGNKMPKSTLIFIILVSLSPQLLADTNAIASLRLVQGTSSILQNGTTIVAKDGVQVFQGDIIKTGGDASLGIIFNDSSRISMGANSELTVTKYVFKPAQKKFGMFTRMMKGTASYRSGRMSQMSPNSISFETPNSTIGTRGTSFLIQVGD